MAQEIVTEQFHTATMKSGVQIRYEDKSHTYWIRHTIEADQDIEGDWVECDFSMSAVADCLAKDGLKYWAEKNALTAIVELLERGYIKVGFTAPDTMGLLVMGQTEWEIPTMENLLYRVKQQKLSVNDTRDKAGSRGNSVHTALEFWVKDGTLPVPEHYPLEEQGYVRGLLAFLHDLGPLKSKPQSEVMVGSVLHRIAGRYDLEAVLHGSNLITKKATPSWTPEGPNHHSAKGPVYTEFKGRTLFDLKTSKDAYLGHKLQMTGYEGCRIECGMPKTEQQLIIVVNDDGTYKAVEANTTWEDFLMVLDIARTTREKG